MFVRTAWPTPSPHDWRLPRADAVSLARTLVAMTVYADLVRYRELFANLFRRDFQAKYRGSVLGIVWSLVNPLALMGVYLVVFSLLWNGDDDPRTTRSTCSRASRAGSSSRPRSRRRRARCSTAPS